MKQYPKQYGLYASYGGPGPIGLAMQLLPSESDDQCIGHFGFDQLIPRKHQRFLGSATQWCNGQGGAGR